MSEAIVVTIDGPAASGKSSVSRGLAQAMGWQWLSTGAFYRGLAYIANHLDISLENEQALSELAKSNKWHIKMAMDRTQVYLGDEDVTPFIYLEEVGGYASKVSSFPLVRKALLEAQRSCTKGLKGLVAEGRDCGTVIFPNASIKIFLTANSNNRAERRLKEQGGELSDLIAQQKERDAQDSSRKAAPLAVPEGAFVIDSSAFSLDEVIQKVITIVKANH